MVKVKDAATRRANYAGSIPSVAGKYKNGVQGASGVIAASIEGQGLYEQRMSDPVVLSRRKKGLEKVTDETWKAAAINKGASRIADGMNQSIDKQVRNYEPYAAALSSLTLPARTADPMANIDNRTKRVVQAFVDVKRNQ